MTRIKLWHKLALSGASSLAIATAVAGWYEGRPLHAYADIGGVPTICYGHTRGVKLGDIATPAQCKAFLASDMAQAIATVERCYPPIPNAPVKAALADLAFNMGPGHRDSRPGRHDGKDGVCILHDGRPPTILRRARAGDWTGVCHGLLAWNKAGGKVLPGLVKRRASEYSLCMGETND